MFPRFRAALLTILALSLTACGEATTLDVTLDNQAANFNKGVTASRRTDADAFIIQLIGKQDPMPSAIDDESSDVLELTLHPADLPAPGVSQTLRLHGTLRIPTDDRAHRTFEPQEDHSAAIASAFFEVSCFCSPVNAETQAWDGTVTLQRASKGRVEVTISASMILDQTRYMTNVHSEGHVDAHATVDGP